MFQITTEATLTQKLLCIFLAVVVLFLFVWAFPSAWVALFCITGVSILSVVVTLVILMDGEERTPEL